MKMTKFQFRSLLANTRFMAGDEPAADTSSGDAGGDAGGDAAATSLEAAAKAAETAATNAEADKTFTQAEVNDFVVKRNKGVQRQLETAEATVETMLKNKQLSDKDRAGLETQLTSLQESMRTKEQQTAHDAKKTKIEYEAALETSQGEATRYKDLFETQTRNNAILAAAGEHDAYNPEIFIDVIGPRTVIMAEVNDAGEETGRQVARTRVLKTADDGTVSEVFVAPEDAIVDMKNDPTKFGGLFRGNVAKGIGEGSNTSLAGDSNIDVSKMTDAEYYANRDAIAKQLNLNQKRSF